VRSGFRVFVIALLPMSADLLKRLRVFVPFALGYFLSYLFRVVNAVIAPNLVGEIGVDPSQLGMLTAAYFISFASFQLPLGVLLDRVGPRRIEAFLLLFAAAGAYVFARADSLAGLVIGRVLIGFGVSACLMAAFKAFVLWFPADQWPRVNGFQMAAGGLGALTATAPVEVALRVTDWRGVFTALALAALVVALAVYVVVPKKRIESSGIGFKDQIDGVREVFASAQFWRIAPLTTLSQASFLAVQGLWAGPWLRDVAGFDRMAVANTLMWIAGAMVVGFASLGALAERLTRVGIRTETTAVAGMTVFNVVQGMIVLEPVRWAVPLWILFGFFGTTGIISYAALSQSFPPHLSGRVNTGVNLLVFIAAFAGQWLIGGIIELWPVRAGGHYDPRGYQAGLAIMCSLQLLGLVWYLASVRAAGRKIKGENKES